jgi:hypothetical protein
LSAKKNFLNRSTVDEVDAQDNYIEVVSPYTPGPTATRVHQSQKKIRLLRGGLGSGKTRTGVQHIDFLANTYPGSLHLVARKDITSLKVTTQREFEKIIIPETIQTFNVHENNLYYKNGSLVIFRETKDPKKVLSLELTSFLLDEVDENEFRDIVDNLERRLRQKIMMDGVEIAPPYAGLCIFNPVPKSHWLFELSQEDNVDDIQFSTYENAHNLPESYIPDLERRFAKAPWEKKRLLDGDWGIEVKGKPVIHGFGPENVRSLQLRPDLPVVRGWDFGFGHPCAKLAQFDPKVGKYGRWMIYRELLGHNEKLTEFAPRVIAMTMEFCQGMPIIDFGDTHGSDHKDVGDTSIDTLKTKFGIYVNHQRQRVKQGLDDIQTLVTETAILSPEDPKLYPCFLVDPMCPNTIDAYTYGYHKGQDGLPVKDGFFDHFVDADRYPIVGMRGRAMVARRTQKKRQPRNRITGY